VILLIFTT